MTSTGSSTKVTLHVEEDGILGLPQVYNGVSYYDALLHYQAMNCYQYRAPADLNVSELAVDLAIVDDQFKGVGDKVVSVESGITAIITLYKSTLPLNQQTASLTQSAMRSSLKYYPETTYKICYRLDNPLLRNRQYSLVINMPDMAMVYPMQSVAKYNPRTSYELYEYINHGPDTQLQITLTNCLGKSEILASSSYYDMRTGKMTEIGVQWKWSVGGVSASVANVSHGYYYIGAKNLEPKDPELYELSVRRPAVINGNT